MKNKKEDIVRELNVAEELSIRKIKKAGLALLAAQAELEKIRQQRYEVLKKITK